MSYTEIYRKIYAAAKDDSVPHEVTHSISIRITDAITTLRSYVRENHPELLEVVQEIVSSTWRENKIGGYDLDDKGQSLHKRD